jgi:hypothetical protein
MSFTGKFVGVCSASKNSLSVNDLHSDSLEGDDRLQELNEITRISNPKSLVSLEKKLGRKSADCHHSAFIDVILAEYFLGEKSPKRSKNFTFSSRSIEDEFEHRNRERIEMLDLVLETQKIVIFIC